MTVLTFLLFCGAVLLVELLDTSVRTCSLLLSRIELMAFGTYFDFDLLLCRTDRKSISAVTRYFSLKILRMNSFSHLVSFSPAVDF